MKSELRKLCVLVLVSTGITVIMEPKDHITLDDGQHSCGFDEAFGACLSRKEHGAFECANRGILSELQSLNDKDSLEFGKLKLDRAEGPHGRDLLDLDYDPKDFGNVVKAATRLMERRNVKWNLDNLYPGLQMRVGPMLNGNGVLEFVLNEGAGPYNDRQAGPGRQLARHVLLPFLLGFKFNLASLIPLMFGFLLIVTKKALLLTKVALFLSGLLGWNTLFSAATAPHATNGFNGFHTHGHQVPIGAYPYYDYHLPHRPYRTAEFIPYDQHVIREVVNVYEGASDTGQSKQNGKNFAWTKNARSA